ncbi:MAG: hypothetical protein GQE15_03955 [Archangiaceae bacterium]|nr:hypothetical protein [Archangiaceae bacterium]
MKFPIIPAIVVAVFVLGFFTGRMSAPTSNTSTPVAMAPMGQPPPMMPPPAMIPPSEPAGGDAVTGVVSEVIQVPSYTYLRLSTEGGDEWAAVATNTGITAGQKLTVRVSTRMQGFVSKSLNRTFDSIIFGELGSGAGAAPGPLAEGAQLPPNHPPMGAPPAAANPNDTVAKAIDATRLAEPALSMRVADVFSEKQMLAGHVVKVSGKLSKVTDVAGVHYGHLSDASGKDDLVIISKEALPNDQQVSVQGVVVLDKDVGIGAKWAVALDNVTVAK